MPDASASILVCHAHAGKRGAFADVPAVSPNAADALRLRPSRYCAFEICGARAQSGVAGTIFVNDANVMGTISAPGDFKRALHAEHANPHRQLRQIWRSRAAASHRQRHIVALIQRRTVSDHQQRTTGLRFK